MAIYFEQNAGRLNAQGEYDYPLIRVVDNPEDGPRYLTQIVLSSGVWDDCEGFDSLDEAIKDASDWVAELRKEPIVQTPGGSITPGITYDIWYRRDTDSQEGYVCGLWSGETDALNRLVIYPHGEPIPDHLTAPCSRSPVCLFPREFTDIIAR